MKVGVVTDDGKTVSPHFGMAQYYLVYEIENGVIKNKELRRKTSHQHGEGHHEGESSLHDTMLSTVRDCEALVTRGMGQPMYEAITQSGIKPILTQERYTDEAVGAYIKGTLDNHPEMVHSKV